MSIARTGRVVLPQTVHEIISPHILDDGYDLVLDLRHSHGQYLIDQRTGRAILDVFSSFATRPIGWNHPGLNQPEFEEKLNETAKANPANSDLWTVEMAEFVQAWAKYAKPPNMEHLFLVAGGAVAAENALKAAFDWKVKKNFQQGYTEIRGQQVMHFTDAFHGRTGYTLSLTNTADPRKYQFFPKHDWPRIPAPARRWPSDPSGESAEEERVTAAEKIALDYARLAFRQRVHDIAAIIIEPIQSEGGDNHFRPEFLRALRQLADEYEALLIFDEVQTGLGLTGKMWAFEHFGVTPDLLVFGKKAQVCGVMAGPRIDEIPNNVFRESSRINSTFGGNLADMVRCQRYLEIIDNEKLLDNAAAVGRELLTDLRLLQLEFPKHDGRLPLSNARGLGLMCAIDFESTEMRDEVVKLAYHHPHRPMIVMPCGRRSIRFRPALDITVGDVSLAIDILANCTATYINNSM